VEQAEQVCLEHEKCDETVVTARRVPQGTLTSVLAHWLIGDAYGYSVCVPGVCVAQDYSPDTQELQATTVMVGFLFGSGAVGGATNSKNLGVQMNRPIDVGTVVFGEIGVPTGFYGLPVGASFALSAGINGATFSATHGVGIALAGGAAVYITFPPGPRH